ncbi:MAG: hypothetical protein ACR2PF_16030, partial [Rhizobiaceae bacterium]
MSNKLFDAHKLFGMLLFLLLASCASPANLIGVGESEISIAPTKGASVQTLFVATSRQRSENSAEFFSGERSDELALGNLNVTIPPGHK